mmetsp:Transcript_27438/g.33613  ORF Transcript_27438/g.33613 Transcript_27438/m.33613 type:complete len:120 (-) Transcript_27438:238-597(-)
MLYNSREWVLCEEDVNNFHKLIFDIINCQLLNFVSNPTFPRTSHSKSTSKMFLVKLLKLIISIPLFIISTLLSVLFIVVWIVLLPIKLCCPCGCVVGLVAWVLETGVKMPVNLAKCILD